MTEEAPPPDRPLLERTLDGPEAALLRLPWPSTARIILKGSFGALRQLVRSRATGLRPGQPTSR